MAESREELIKRLEGQANKIRRNIWRALKASGSGHAGGSLSAAETLAVLYFHKMNIRPNEPDWPDRDRFILSKGHANAGLGAALELAGFVDDDYVNRFYAMDDGRSPFGMHPDIKVPGIEISTGGLGHGLPVGVGMALGARIKGKSFHTYVMIGDGELHEGSNWEAAMAGAKYRLTNLTAIIDANKISQSAHVAEIMGDRAAGRQVARVRLGSPRVRRPQHRRGRRRPGRPAVQQQQAELPDHPHRQGQGRQLRRGHLPLAPERGQPGDLRQGNRRAGDGLIMAAVHQPPTTGAPSPRARPASPSARRCSSSAAIDPTSSSSRPTPRICSASASTSSCTPSASSSSASPSRTRSASRPGLATVGLKPYVCGYAPFVTARGLEQVRNDVAYAHQNVVIGAAASGISLGVSGGTHHAVEDLATMRSFAEHDGDRPGRRQRGVQGDALARSTSTARSTSAWAAAPRAGHHRSGRAVHLRQGDRAAVRQRRRDHRLRRLVEMAVKASDALKAEGISARVLNMSTIKPLDTDAILKAAEETKGHRDRRGAPHHRRARRRGGRVPGGEPPDEDAAGRPRRRVRGGRPDACRCGRATA